jgi:chromosome segregation ATPase
MVKSATTNKEYTSPVRKLVHFFEKSRDQWKTKCREAKAQIKLLKNRVRFLEKSRGQWRERVQELESEIARLRAREQALEKEVEVLQKKGVKSL